MTIYTLNDLLYAKGTSEPVRQMLVAMAEKIEQLDAAIAARKNKKEWVGLTEQEVGGIMEDLNAYGTRLYEFAHAIEARLKEKNT